MNKIRRRMSISASHQLYLPYDSKCNGLHGHNYEIEVHIEAEELNKDGMVCDFTYVTHWINKQFDHKHLNERFAEMSQLFMKVGGSSLHSQVFGTAIIEPAKFTTAEVFARLICEALRYFYQVNVTEVQIGETNNCIASYIHSDVTGVILA